jgi:hypothetical protein
VLGRGYARRATRRGECSSAPPTSPPAPRSGSPSRTGTWPPARKDRRHDRPPVVPRGARAARGGRAGLERNDVDLTALSPLRAGRPGPARSAGAARAAELRSGRSSRRRMGLSVSQTSSV